jgi:hypothetical protein
MSDVPQAIHHKANEKHGAHRTRATWGGNFTTAAVYLTDAKRVDPPAPSTPKPVPAPAKRMVELADLRPGLCVVVRR